MIVIPKLRKFLEDNGIQKKWLSTQLGLTHPTIHHFLHYKRKVPIKYWAKIIQCTRGYITIEDFMNDLFENAPGIQVVPTRGDKRCTVSLKDLNELEKNV